MVSRGGRRRVRRTPGIADPAGRLRWISAALPGSTHDLSVASNHRIIEALAAAKVMTFVDKGYQGAGGNIRPPFKRHRRRPQLSRREKGALSCGDTELLAPQVVRLLAQRAWLIQFIRYRPAGLHDWDSSGLMLALRWKILPGSYFVLMAASRLYLRP
jgi:hypothetical protein